ncbi:ABC transporter permease [Longispora albida]|uniref:ABC transporter permease n=1 Tax=Longispora albida TaxID=203523 RepID=UPI00036CD388|nr:ABC transporter permease [Longispora albida]
MSDFETVAATENHAATPGPAGEPGAPGQPDNTSKVRSLAGDAWHDLRRKPIFIISSLIILVMVVMAAFPTLFTSADPRSCELGRSMKGPSGDAIFGYNLQGCDVFARTVHGASTSIQVGLYSTILAGVLAVVIGMLAGFYGGILDAILARIIDIILGIPLLLAAIVALKGAGKGEGYWGPLLLIVFILGIFGWTTAARIVRSSVISAKQQDYVHAAKMLGASNSRIMVRHILPNAMAPVIVVLTIALGAFITAEATLSFLGVGLQDPIISWGKDISEAAKRVRDNAVPMLVPSTFLSLTVLSFIMLGDAVREAFDPRLR